MGQVSKQSQILEKRKMSVQRCDYGWSFMSYFVTFHRNSIPVLALWHYRLWSFKTRDTKLERLLHKNQHTQRKLLNYVNWTNGEPQNLQKLEFLKLIILIFHEKKNKKNKCGLPATF